MVRALNAVLVTVCYYNTRLFFFIFTCILQPSLYFLAHGNCTYRPSACYYRATHRLHATRYAYKPSSVLMI